MADPQFTTGADATPVQKKSKGCWFYGCITLVVLVVLVAIGAFFAVRYVASKVTGAIQQYSQTTPQKLPELRLTREERTEVQKRSENFQQSLSTPSATPHELTLTGDELNALLVGVDGSGTLAKTLRVKIEGDVISGTVSVPLSFLHLEQLGDRYLNGEAAFRVSMIQGLLWVTLKEFKLKDQPIPPAMLAGLQNVNLAEQWNKDPKVSSILSKLDTLEVRDGKLTIRTKTAQ